eukprot:jgi/Bigna1/134335/aug1.24_g9043
MGRKGKRKRSSSKSGGKQKNKKSGGNVDIMIAPEGPSSSGGGGAGCTLKVSPIPEGSIPQAVAIHFEDFGKLLKVQVFGRSEKNQTAYALVTFDRKVDADKAAGTLTKKYLFPQIRGRKTQVSRVASPGDDDDDDEETMPARMMACDDDDDDLLELDTAASAVENKVHSSEGDPNIKLKEDKGKAPRGRVDQQKLQQQQQNTKKKKKMIKEPVRLESLEEGKEVVELKDPRMMSRLLYPNPVCLLTVAPPEKTANVMTISWLTPANNYGSFLMSINKRRHSASLLSGREGAEFVLSVPTHFQEEMVLNIGKKSGSRCDKMKELSIVTCPPGWKHAGSKTTHKGGGGGGRYRGKTPGRHQRLGGGNPFALLATLDDDNTTEEESKGGGDKGENSRGDDKEKDTEQKGNDKTKPQNVNNEKNVAVLKREIEALCGIKYKMLAIEKCVAHLECHVEKMAENFVDDSHFLIKAQIDKAYVRKSHWCGKNFRPRIHGAGSILTFLGSQRFGHLRPAEA